LGPIQKADSRQAVVARMLDLMEQAKGKGADFIVYPELALTTFFPRWYHEDRAEADFWFEKEMPNAATRPLFERAVKHGLAMSFGYAELTPDGHHFNTSILVDRKGTIIGKYRKVHLPGHAERDKERAFQHLEKRYFEPGDLGFPVWRFMDGIFGMCICNDRRWPETFRSMGLQGVEMVTLGFNTPSVNSQKSGEGSNKRIFHHKLSVQAGATRTRPGWWPSPRQASRMATHCSGRASSSIRTGRWWPRRSRRQTRSSCTPAISMPPASAKRPSSILSGIVASNIMGASRHRSV